MEGTAIRAIDLLFKKTMYLFYPEMLLVNVPPPRKSLLAPLYYRYQFR